MFLRILPKKCDSTMKVEGIRYQNFTKDDRAQDKA